MTHTIDNGHPASYDHEAESHFDPASDAVELACACGEWNGYATADPDDDYGVPAALFCDWESHVYDATGQTPPEAAEQRPEADWQCVAVALAELDEMGIRVLDIPGGRRSVVVIFGDGPWELTFRSVKPESKAMTIIAVKLTDDPDVALHEHRPRYDLSTRPYRLVCADGCPAWPCRAYARALKARASAASSQ